MALGDTKIKKHRFHYHENPILVDDVDIDKKLVPSNISFGKKSFLNILLVTKIMEKSIHYVWWFQK